MLQLKKKADSPSGVMLKDGSLLQEIRTTETRYEVNDFIDLSPEESLVDHKPMFPGFGTTSRNQVDRCCTRAITSMLDQTPGPAPRSILRPSLSLSDKDIKGELS